MQEQLTNILSDPLLVAILAGLALVFVAVLIVWAILRSADKSRDIMRHELAEMHKQQSELKGALSAIQENAQTGSSELQKALNDRLDVMSKRMNDGLNDSREKTHESLKNLGERLAIIDRAQKNIEALGQEVSGLQAVLSNKQARGAFGEMRMQDMVEDSLPATAYSFQTTLTNGKRVDCLIKLPNEGGAIPVDAKFPLESWRAMSAAEDQATRDGAGRQLRADIRKHVSDIAGKYLIPGETNDTALLFLPSEAIYADLHGHFRDVVEEAFKSRVMIVSPTTFMAALHTISSLIKDARMREQAHLIQKEVGMMLKDVERLETRAQKLSNRFRLTEEAVEEIVKSTTGIARHAGRIADVDVDPREVESDVPNLKLVTGQGED